MFNFNKKFIIFLLFVNLRTEFNSKLDAIIAAGISSSVLKILNLNISSENMEYKFDKNFSINGVKIGKELNDFSFDILTECLLANSCKDIYKDVIKFGDSVLNKKALEIFDINFLFLIKLLNNTEGLCSFIKNKFKKMPKKLMAFCAVFGAINSYKDYKLDNKIENKFKDTKNEKLKKLASKIGFLAVKNIIMSKLIEIIIPFVAILTSDENDNFDQKDSEDAIKQGYNLTELSILGFNSLKSVL